MGFLWDMVQQSQISTQHQRAEGVEARLGRLEVELSRTQELLRELICRLEAKLGTDLDRDGKVG